MKQETVFTDRVQAVQYDVLDNKTIVMVRKFIREETVTDEDYTQTFYVYETNEFECNPDEITKEMVESNLDYYLDYSSDSVSLEEQIKQLREENKLLQNCVLELSEVLFNG